MDREEILQSHLAKGERASKIYHSYLSEKIDDYKGDILRDFMNAPADTNALLSLKFKLDFIMSFERTIIADIDNGVLARQELNL